MHAGPSSAACLRHAGHDAEYEPEAAREPEEGVACDYKARDCLEPAV